MSERKRVVILIGIMAAVVIVVTLTSIALLYTAALKAFMIRLSETAQSQARFAETVYHHEQSERRNSSYALKVALSELQEANRHMKWFSLTSEFTIAEKQRSSMRFLIRRHQQQGDKSIQLPLNGNTEVAMQRALSGHSGTMIGVDYRNNKVLAAYEPIPGPGWGVVVKIDLAEVQKPFKQAAALAGLAALALAAAGAGLFVKITNPMLTRILESNQLFRTLFNRANEGIFLISLDGKIIEVNESIARMHGYSTNEMLNMHLEDLDIPESKQLMPERMRRLLAGEALTFEVGHYHKDRHIIHLEVSASLITYGGESVIQTFHRDITERKQIEENLRDLSLIDELTGLNNRRGFTVLADQLLKTAIRLRLGVALIYLDLDGLKIINDNLGHSEGDRALIDTAELFRKSFRASDIIARLGGDEFVGLAVEITENSSSAILTRLENSLAVHNAQEDRPYRLSISYGIARSAPEEPYTLDLLLKNGDQLMYEQKRSKAASRETMTTSEVIV